MPAYGTDQSGLSQLRGQYALGNNGNGTRDRTMEQQYNPNAIPSLSGVPGYGGQQPNLGRYSPPMMNGHGNSGWQNSPGPYAYNLPNSFGPYLGAPMSGAFGGGGGGLPPGMPQFSNNTVMPPPNPGVAQGRDGPPPPMDDGGDQRMQRGAQAGLRGSMGSGMNGPNADFFMMQRFGNQAANRASLQQQMPQFSNRRPMLGQTATPPSLTDPQGRPMPTKPALKDPDYTYSWRDRINAMNDGNTMPMGRRF